MQTTSKADIEQNIMVMECIIPGPIWQSKSTNICDVCMKFYNEAKLLYLETGASGIGLDTTPLQTRDGMTCPKDTAPDNTILRPITFASKSLTSGEPRYSNTEREALGILHGLERFCHYCFAREVSIISNHKPLVAIFIKDTAILLQRI